jgi:hypothetical protein
MSITSFCQHIDHQAVAHCNKVNWIVPGGNNLFYYSYALRHYLTKLILRVAGDTTSKPGANSCTWGPAFWCAKPENAKACGEEVISNEEYEFNIRQLLIGIIYL